MKLSSKVLAILAIATLEILWADSSRSSTTTSPAINHTLPTFTIESHKLSTSKCDTNNQTAGCDKFHSAPKPSLSQKPSGSTNEVHKSSTTKKPGLITKTTDAIYKILSNVFTHEDQEDGDEDLHEAHKIEATTFVYNSTRRLSAATTPTPNSERILSNATISPSPQAKVTSPASDRTSTRAATTAKLEATSTKAPSSTSARSTVSAVTPVKVENVTQRWPEFEASSNRNNKLDELSRATNSSSTAETKLARELYSIISIAYQSLNKLRESGFLNRSTRLAPKHNEDEQEQATMDKERAKPERLQMSPGDPTAPKVDEQEVHLLCKLLHKHLDEHSNATGGLSQALKSLLSTTPAPPPTSSEQQQTSTSRAPAWSSPKPPDAPKQLFVSSLKDLDESEEAHLLETVLSFEPSDERDLASLERSAQGLMAGLFNMASRSRDLGGRPSSYSESESLLPENNPDYVDTDDSRSLVAGGSSRRKTQNFTLPEAPFRVRSWRRTSEKFNSHFHYVYWLLEQRLYRNADDEANPIVRFKVLDWRRASELLDRQLTHSDIRSQFEEFRFGLIGNLVSAYKPDEGRERDHKHQEEQAHAYDDSLVPTSGSPAGGPKQSQAKSQQGAFQMFFERLSRASFQEDLQLYLIIFLITLFLVILCCCMVPMFCYKRGESSQRASSLKPKASRIVRDRQAHRGRQKAQIPQLPEQQPRSEPTGERYPKVQLGGGNGSVWRKLSNTTMTLVKDQSEMLHEDGSMKLPVRSQLEQEATGSVKKSPFEWYSFEDRLEEEEERRVEGDSPSKSYVISDKRQVTKSLQAFDPTIRLQEKMLLMDFKNKHENRNSNTLTKSELVMLKEKLIPVNLREAEPAHDYVNQQRWMPSKASQTSGDCEANAFLPSFARTEEGEPSKRDKNNLRSSTFDIQRASFIDKNSSSSSGGSGKQPTTVLEEPKATAEQLERRPKMRHVELEPKTKSNLEAIKSELGRIEERDRELAAGRGLKLSSEYKRYDVI